jgi:hypothetical protein
MGQVNNQNDADFRRMVLDKIGKLERATPMNNAAIGRGGIEVYDGGEITITNGGLSVTGKATITGILEADGTITFTGNFTQTGPTVFQGTLSVEGVTTVKNDFNVTTGGKIKVGTAMVLDPSVSAGALVFSNGAQVFTDATTVQMFKGGSVCQVDDASAKIQATGGYVKVDSSGVNLNGPLRNTSGSTITGVTANVYMDASGNIKKIV